MGGGEAERGGGLLPLALVRAHKHMLSRGGVGVYDGGEYTADVFHPSVDSIGGGEGGLPSMEETFYFCETILLCERRLPFSSSSRASMGRVDEEPVVWVQASKTCFRWV